MKKKSRSIISRLSNNITNEANIFHDLMPYKVKEILLIAHIYDAISIEQEGRLSETILGDYHKLNITSIPRITSVNTYEDAMENLKQKAFDMVIIMVGIDNKIPLRISKQIQKEQAGLPVYLLLNNPKYVEYYHLKKNKKYYDKLFIWSGEPSIFFAMVKMQEDRYNLKNDIEKIGLSRILLLVEDNPQYYSRYIPTLYQSVMRQTLRITEDSDIIDESYKFLKLRLRPKILHTDNYEEAKRIYKAYKNNMLCVISDVKYKKNGSKEGQAGFELIKYIKKYTPDLPTAIESSDMANKAKAEAFNSHFLYKKSPSLHHDFQHFIKYYLGFGAFIFRLPDGREIDRAENPEEFYRKLKTLDEQSLVFHASKNHFSLWLRARGEFKPAENIVGYKPEDFDSPEEIRNILLESFYKYRVEQNKGLIIETDDPTIAEESNIGQLTPGALGGKGRGLAFINKMIYKFDCNSLIPGIRLKTPKTFIIGTDEFDRFIEDNKLYDTVYNQNPSYENIRELFLTAGLSERLLSKLEQVLDIIQNPIAVRSSGLFEDSLMQPFAGVFATYLLPNNHLHREYRMKQLTDAVKLVFASVFSEASKSYIQTINYNIEDEKMAVVLQEVVGNRYGDYYFPHISGTAQSFNYYPYGKIQPEDGSAVLAIGLGMYVVEGEKALRFCPVHPKLQNHSPKDMMSNSQRELYAVDLSKQVINFSAGETAGLKRIKIRKAEKLDPKHMKHCLSVYDGNNDVISPGIDKIGPRVANFGNILKYNYIPLADTIKKMLDIMKEAMGAPVEIEFSVDLNKEDNLAKFYLLQVKPLIGNDTDYSIDFKKTDIKNSLLVSRNSMGNGLIDHIKDVIIIPPEKFDNMKTQDIAKEVSVLNNQMINENREYLLIGPGRWGSRDKWIGVPVLWSQISKARVIVEAGLPDFPLEASAGSHFFHNVTSMNVAYMSVQHNSEDEFIRWEKFNNFKIHKAGKFALHIRLDKPLNIQIDGKKRITVIS